MVTCNVCRANKSVEEMQTPFRYVCSSCWKQMVVGKKNNACEIVELNKDLLY